MKLVIAEAIPLMVEVKVLVVVEMTLVFTKFAVVVDMTPFTDEVKIKALEVVAILIKLAMVVVGTLVVEMTPFTLEVRI